jgi:hypothetical protein
MKTERTQQKPHLGFMQDPETGLFTADPSGKTYTEREVLALVKLMDKSHDIQIVRFRDYSQKNPC